MADLTGCAVATPHVFEFPRNLAAGTTTDNHLHEKLIEVLAATGSEFFNATVDFLNEMIGGIESFIYLECPERAVKLVVKGTNRYWSGEEGRKILRQFPRDILPAATPIHGVQPFPFFRHCTQARHYLILPFDIDAESCCILTLFSKSEIVLPQKFHYAYKVLGQRITHEARQLFTQEKIRRIAHYDHLTGLANRRILDKHIEILAGLSRRNGTKLALLFLDLDNFKEINDRYGHQIGDLVLVEVSRLLKERCRRKSDLVARYGGDEFIIVLSAVKKFHEPVMFAEGLLAGLNSFCLRSDIRVRLSASIGISMFPTFAETPADLIATADKALYHAKGAGKNRCAVYNFELREV